MKHFARLTSVILLGASSAMLSAQSTGTLTQTINKRNTLGSLGGQQSLADSNAPLASNMPVGTEILFTYQLFDGGAPAPTGEPLTVYDTINGSPVQLSPVDPHFSTVLASNLLPYSQVDTTQGWTVNGNPSGVTVTPGNASGPDGSTPTEFTNMALSALGSTVTFQDGTSGVQFAVSGSSATSYANQPMTYSVWAYSTTATSINVALEDGAQAAQGSAACPLAANTWTRCVASATFSAAAAAGFTPLVTGPAGSTVVLFGNQVEQAASAGPYVSTIGSARTNIQTVQYTFAYDDFAAGSHNVTVQYAGDANLVGSTSNVVAFTFGQGTATATVVDSPAATSVYGQPVTLTATVSGPDIAPTGTVTFLDGSTSLGTGTLDNCTNAVSGSTTTYSCTATLNLNGSGGTKLLGVGSHSITVNYGGDSNFNAATSAAITHVVTAASYSNLTTSLTSSLNPSSYGDAVTLTATVSVNSALTPNPLPLLGTITVTDGSTTLGTINCSTQGSTTCTGTVSVPSFTAGTHNITATYGGDPNYQ